MRLGVDRFVSARGFTIIDAVTALALLGIAGLVLIAAERIAIERAASVARSLEAHLGAPGVSELPVSVCAPAATTSTAIVCRDGGGKEHYFFIAP